MNATHFKHFEISAESNYTTVWIDVRDKSVNVFDEFVLAELSKVLDHLEATRPACIVFRSRRKSGFFAGADVSRISSLSSDAEVANVIRVGQELFNRIEEFAIPIIAAIHGVCLGGGLEFALACHYRIAVDLPATQMGLPEIKLGLIPGWGGTYRLPRLIGLKKALPMILTGKTVGASDAKRSGVVDDVVAEDRVDDFVDEFCREVLNSDSRTEFAAAATRRGRSIVQDNAFTRWLALRMAESSIRSQSRFYPATESVIRAVRAGVSSREAGLKAEREEFADLLKTDTCRNLLDIFGCREKARNLETWLSVLGEGVGPAPTVPFERIGIVGGGAMGSGIAALAARCGLEVIVREVSEESADAAQARMSRDLTRFALRNKFTELQTAELLARVRVTTDYRDLSYSDVVIEAVFEDLNLKRRVIHELEENLPRETVIVTNTSALSVTEISRAAMYPDRIGGLHFFNPVHRLELVEVIRGSLTADRTTAVMLQLSKRLSRTPVTLSDSPGFLVNRVLFPYMAEAVRMLLEGHDPRTIDSEARRFGMPMGPIELIDHVGLDVALHVAESLVPVLPEAGTLSKLLADMVKRDWRGSKSDLGFYLWKGSRVRRVNPELGDVTGSISGTNAVPDTETKDECIHPDIGEFLNDGMTQVQRRLIYALLNEAARCVDEGVVRADWMADIAMVLGTGYAPFRGGPLRTAERIGRATLLNNLQVLVARYGRRFQPASFLVHGGDDSHQEQGSASTQAEDSASNSDESLTC